MGSSWGVPSDVWCAGFVFAFAALATGCGRGSEPMTDGGVDSAGYVTCCIDNRYAQCECFSENCDGPFIANCGGGACANFFPMTPMPDPCEGVP